MEIVYKNADTAAELWGILDLQKANHTHRITQEEAENQGFVTVNHSFEQLQKMNEVEKHLIAKENDKVIAYILAMTVHAQFDIPILVPMFELFKQIIFKGKAVSDYQYMVVGQVCVAKEYRGQGLFDACYAEYKKCFQEKYDFAITEIACANTRSRNAHKRVGFQEVMTYTSPDKIEWSIVIWDWKNS
jgi:predicted GNAT superfamily acetyltransferase